MSAAAGRVRPGRPTSGGAVSSNAQRYGMLANVRREIEAVDEDSEGILIHVPSPCDSSGRLHMRTWVSPNESMVAVAWTRLREWNNPG